MGYPHLRIKVMRLEPWRRIFLSKNYDAAVSRALEDLRVDDEEATYVTPYGPIVENLRTQNSRARSAAAELVTEAFGLHTFDALTIARSAADLTQLKEAIRNPRQRRYGKYIVRYIEFDVVTWRILPSIENIRFEGERAWSPGKAARYGALSTGDPVLTLDYDDVEALTTALKKQTRVIWAKNSHSKSIPLRGIENSGLLSVSRLSLGDNQLIGILDATDGFSRTVGAHKGSGVDIDDVLFALQDEAMENRLRLDLIALRDNFTGDLKSPEGERAAARLRSSIMPRAQVIVGYGTVDPAESNQLPPFDSVRRSIVGHIHLEPPLKFEDTTEFALKARIALAEVAAKGMLAAVDGFSTDQLLRILLAESEQGSEFSPDLKGVQDMFPDEVLAVAYENLDSFKNPPRGRVVISSIYALTGKKPSRLDRAALAADTALRVNRIAAGRPEDAGFKGRRSTIQRVLAAAPLKGAQLSRKPICDLVEAAVEKLALQRRDMSETSRTISPEAAELGVLALYCLVEGASQPLLVRSGERVDGVYRAEPPQIMEKLVTTTNGVKQLGQIILDVRAGREPRLLNPGEDAEDRYRPDASPLSKEHLYAYVEQASRSTAVQTDDPETARQVYENKIRDCVKELETLVAGVRRVKDDGGDILVEKVGLSISEEMVTLNRSSSHLTFWNGIAERRNPLLFDDSEDDDLDDDLGQSA
ncbi:hypothetical protein FBY31_3897 [Arthrobacter sp. SLBN-100]|nr:hypothetical protein FBY31_3897 [Arthrobacter sp. SLBN-100]